MSPETSTIHEITISSEITTNDDSRDATLIPDYTSSIPNTNLPQENTEISISMSTDEEKRETPIQPLAIVVETPQTSNIAKEKKRKNPATNNLTLSLHVCVLTIIDILNNGRRCEKTDTIVLANPKEIFEIYHTHYSATLSAKRQRTQEPTTHNESIIKTSIVELITTEKAYYRVLSMIITSLFKVMESRQVTFLFSKEHFKFFLATRKNYVDIAEFEDSNKIKSIDDLKSGQTKKRPSKVTATQGTANTLSSGAILVEYYKNCDTFNASLVRCDQDDLKALKLIMQHNLRLDPGHYNWAFSIAQRFVDVEYKIDTNSSIRDNYTCIQMPSSNIKRFVVMITKFIILMYDGSNQFVLPSVNVERDFTTCTLNALKDDEYAFFDVLSGGSKKNIIDIIDAKFFADESNEKIAKPLSENYPDRLALVMQKFKDLKPVDVKYNSSGNCIKKPDVGFDSPSYIYIKPPLTAGIVATHKKTAYVAFMNNEETQLIIKEKFTISGSIASIIMVSPHQNTKFQSTIATDAPAQTSAPYIYHNGMIHEVKFDNFASNDILANKDNLKYLKHVIPVEIVGTKLGRLSANSIAHVDEYRQQNSAALKDVNIEHLLRMPIQELATKLSKHTDTAALIKSLQSFQPNIEIDEYDL